MLTLIIILAFGLCWGSFLNMFSYRLIQRQTVLGRSHCPHCDTTIAWFDLIPLVSYAILKGSCRSCSKPISLLYPGIEIVTAFCLTAGYYFIEDAYHFAFFIFFSALIVTIRTDLEYMLVSQWMTIALIPLGILFSFTDLLPLYPLSSIVGAAVGYCVPWGIATLFQAFTKKEGIGPGDFDLLALIGAFTGVVGVFSSLFIGSLLGSIIGTIFLYLSGRLQRDAKIPFGPFLASGAIIYVLLEEYINAFLFGI